MLERSIYKSFIHNVIIIQRKNEDGSFETTFEMNCDNDYQVKRAFKKHQRFTVYNHHQFLKQYPKNEWLIFEVYQNNMHDLTSNIQLIAVTTPGMFRNPYAKDMCIPYKFITSQKHEPNPRQVTLLRTLGLLFGIDSW